LFHEFFKWLQEVPGAIDGDPTTSWRQQLLGSLNLWSLLEGTHVMTLVLFAGTILLVDLRLLGLSFRTVPFSVLNRKILPLTVAGFLIMIVTGVLLFLSKPEVYYHSVWFRTKVIFLFVAALNIFWFHFRVQRNEAEWDALPRPPLAARISGAVSILSWTLVILFGRFTAYNWFDCDKLGAYIAGYEQRGHPMGEGFFKGLYSYGECASAMAVPPGKTADSTPVVLARKEAAPADPTPAANPAGGN
jgi:hypothetical protein